MILPACKQRFGGTLSLTEAAQKLPFVCPGASRVPCVSYTCGARFSGGFSSLGSSYARRELEGAE